MLSSRGTRWAKIGYTHGRLDKYNSDTNPGGIVDFSWAENNLMHDVLLDFINKNSKFDEHCCTYGEGYTGTVRLRQAMANHMNTFFKPAMAIDAEEITFAAGVTELNEVCALLTCDEGEAVMLGRPIYGSFYGDLTTRTGVNLEYVDVGDINQFDPGCVAAFEAGYHDALERGIKIKALLICNPHNPLGRCYSREAVEGLIRLCGSLKIHLISDEIYALSVYERDDRPNESFTSVRAIDYEGIIDPGYVHVLYGMSKDFGAAGMRLGCIVSQNKEFVDAVRATCRFASPSQFSMQIATRILEDQNFVETFTQRSRAHLCSSRLFTEKLLRDNSITFSEAGNAGFFFWLDLSHSLPLTEVGGDPWKAERLLKERFRQEGVVLSTGEAYRSPDPGRFRLCHCVEQSVLEEGIKRISRVLSG